MLPRKMKRKMAVKRENPKARKVGEIKAMFFFEEKNV